MDDVGLFGKMLDWAAALIAAWTAYLHNRVDNNYKSLKEMEVNFQKMRTDNLETFVTNEEHQRSSNLKMRMMDRLDTKLDLIIEKLDKKADKH